MIVVMDGELSEPPVAAVQLEDGRAAEEEKSPDMLIQEKKLPELIKLRDEYASRVLPCAPNEEKHLEAAGLEELYQYLFCRDTDDAVPISPDCLSGNCRNTLALLAEGSTGTLDNVARVISGLLCEKCDTVVVVSDNDNGTRNHQHNNSDKVLALLKELLRAICDEKKSFGVVPVKALSRKSLGASPTINSGGGTTTANNAAVVFWEITPVHMNAIPEVSRITLQSYRRLRLELITWNRCLHGLVTAITCNNFTEMTKKRDQLASLEKKAAMKNLREEQLREKETKKRDTLREKEQAMKEKKRLEDLRDHEKRTKEAEKLKEREEKRQQKEEDKKAKCASDTATNVNVPVAKDIRTFFAKRNLTIFHHSKRSADTVVEVVDSEESSSAVISPCNKNLHLYPSSPANKRSSKRIVEAFNLMASPDFWERATRPITKAELWSAHCMDWRISSYQKRRIYGRRIRRRVYYTSEVLDKKAPVSSELKVAPKRNYLGKQQINDVDLRGPYNEVFLQKLPFLRRCVLCFYYWARPPQFLLINRSCKIAGRRRPFARESFIDYDRDSDDEWAEDFGADDLEKEDEEEDAMSDEENESDDFFVPDGDFMPGEVSDEEDANAVAPMAEVKKKKNKVIQACFFSPPDLLSRFKNVQATDGLTEYQEYILKTQVDSARVRSLVCVHDLFRKPLNATTVVVRSTETKKKQQTNRASDGASGRTLSAPPIIMPHMDACGSPNICEGYNNSDGGTAKQRLPDSTLRALLQELHGYEHSKKQFIDQFLSQHSQQYPGLTKADLKRSIAAFARWGKSVAGGMRWLVNTVEAQQLGLILENKAPSHSTAATTAPPAGTQSSNKGGKKRRQTISVLNGNANIVTPPPHNNETSGQKRRKFAGTTSGEEQINSSADDNLSASATDGPAQTTDSPHPKGSTTTAKTKGRASLPVQSFAGGGGAPSLLSYFSRQPSSQQEPQQQGGNVTTTAHHLSPSGAIFVDSENQSS